MSSGGGGTTQTTTNNSPPPEFLAAYNNIVQRAQGVAGTPFQQYPGQTVADLSPDQLSGIQGIQGAQGVYAPYIDTAANYIQSGLNGPNGITAASANGVGGIQAAGQSFSPDSIQQFVNPWTQQVVDATQAQFNNQNQQQANGLRGNAISSGAFGGDREGVAQGVLAGQQQLAQAPVIAGLRSTGYQTGIQAAETQAAQRLQAAQAAGALGLQGATANTAANLQGSQQMAALGQAAHANALTDAGALLGVGGLEQQQAQAYLNVPYQQWQAELAYPFQTTSWLSGLTTGLGGASGGMSSSSQTAPGASGGSQALGVGLAGVGALGQSGAFGNNGWLTGSNGWFGSGGGNDYNAAYQAGAFAAQPAGAYGPFAANGGAIPQRARGGTIPSFAFGGMTSADAPGMTPIMPSGLNVPDLSVSVIPSMAPGGKPLVMNNFGQTSTGSGGGPSGAQQAQSALGTIGTIASIASMFSDRRLKDDISRVGKLHDGTPVYRYRYKGDPQWHIGFIADQLEKDHPEAVGMSHGYGIVDTKAATDKSAGMHHVNDNWDGGWHEPKRAVGGAVTGVDMMGGVPQLVRGSPMSGMASPAGISGGGIQEYLGNARAAAPGVHPMTWNPSMIPVAPAPAPTGDDLLKHMFSEPSNFFGNEGGGGEGGGEARNGGRIGLADGGDPLGFSPSTPLGMASIITDAATRYGIPPSLARAYLQQESGMGAASGNIGQITGATAANPGYGLQPISAADMQDPQKNVDFSMRYMRARGDAAGVKDWNDPAQQALALKAYNGGGDPDYVQHVSRWLPGDTGTNYAEADTGTATDATFDDALPASDTGGMAAPASSVVPVKSSADPWSALTYAGLGVLGGNSPNAGVNIGRGALAGLHEYQTQKTLQQRADALAEWRQSQATTNAARTVEQSRHNRESEATTAARLADQLDLQRKNVDLRQQQVDQGRYTWQPGQGPDPKDPEKTVDGSWRYPAKGDEQPQFYPGVVQKKPGADTGKLSDDTTAAIAERLIAGDQGAVAGLGYGNTGAANRAAVQEKVTQLLRAQGKTGADLAASVAGYMGEKAGARTAGTREANVSMAINEAQLFMPLALDASDKVQRTNFPTLNSIIQAVEKGTGDENVVRLAVATNSLINAYSRAVTPSGIPTEGNQQRARELLDRAWSQGQYRSAVDQLMKEMSAAKQSPIQTKEEQRQRISGSPSGNESAVPTQATATTAAPSLPPEAASKLQEGHVTTFQNGQKWMLKDGKPQRVQ